MYVYVLLEEGGVSGVELAAPLQDLPPELTATNATLWGIISRAPFYTTRSASSIQSGDSEPDIPLDMHMGLYLHLITFQHFIQIQDIPQTGL